MMGDKVVIGGKGTTTDAGMHVPLIASWPGMIASGKVTSDLVDSTDFLPTICAGGGCRTHRGQNRWPQLPAAAPRAKRARRGSGSIAGTRRAASRSCEFAFDQHYKLYRSGEFFDLEADPAEKRPLTVASLTGEAATAAKKLQAALDQYRDARPSNLPQPGTGEAKAKKARKNKAN